MSRRELYANNRVAPWFVGFLWLIGVVLLAAGSSTLGYAFVGVAIVLLLLRLWARGGSWLPDGGGLP